MIAGIPTLLLMLAIMVPTMRQMRGPIPDKPIREIRRIVASYLETSASSKFADCVSVHDWAIELAKKGGINDPMCFTLNGYGNWNAKMNGFIYDQSTERYNTEFLKLTVVYSIASGLPPELNTPSRIPLIWTTGLTADGTWSEESPWGNYGGFVAYCDGSVLWMNRAEFHRFGTFEKTKSIQEALPPGAKILYPRKLDGINNLVETTEASSPSH